MIQRIQTIYLLLAVLCLSAVFFTDIAHYTDAAGIKSELSLYALNNANGEVEPVDFGLLPVSLYAVAAAMLFASILLYRNRSTQRRVIRFAYLFIIGGLIAVWYFVSRNYWDLDLTEPDLGYRVGFFLPFASIAFAMLASRAIRRDEELIKSLDRIR